MEDWVFVLGDFEGEWRRRGLMSDFFLVVVG